VTAASNIKDSKPRCESEPCNLELLISELAMDDHVFKRRLSEKTPWNELLDLARENVGVGGPDNHDSDRDTS
jgi:hypothetical protein